MIFDKMPALTPSDVIGPGPEDVLFAPDGSIYTGLGDGRLMHKKVGEDAWEMIANTGGRLLGLEFLDKDTIIACDATKGLLAIDLVSREIKPLVTEYEGQRLSFCNNASVSREGAIYFSQSSTRYGIENSTRDILEYVPTGRLFKRLSDGRVKCLADGLYFANGVLVAPDESFVLVAETGAARISRLWLKGELKGQRDIFADNLPGLPDNLSLGSDGLIWVALAAAMSKDIRKLHSAPKWLRQIIAYFITKRESNAARTVLLAAFDRNGKSRYQLSGDTSNFFMATGVREQNGQVIIGSVADDKIASFEFNQPRPAVGIFKTIRTKDNRLVGYYDSGEGQPFVLSASLGRSVSDFNELVTDLNTAGIRTIAVESRGIGPGLRTQRFRQYDLYTLADDIAAVLEQEEITDPVILLGHAYGNRVIRCFATKYSVKTSQLILLAAGGIRNPEKGVEAAMRGCFAPNLTRDQLDEHLRTAFFAKQRDIPEFWRTGWHVAVANGQSAATKRTPAKTWWRGGGKPTLAFQGVEDAVAPADQTSDLLKQSFGDQIDIIELQTSGHAMLPEQPEEILTGILEFLERDK